jgi:pimeloyl-ACP methyl ester carboxylesterase
VVAPDLRGHGDSTRAGERSDFRKAELAADVLAVLDELGIGRVRAAGHDWGGAVAQELALAAPRRVTQLALLSCPALNNPAGERAAVSAFGSEGGTALWYQHFQQQRGLPEAMIPGNEGTWLRHFLRDGRGQPLADEVIAETVRWYSLPGTPGACANLYRALRADRQHWETLRGHVWAMPGLYLYGAHDPVVLPAYAAAVEPCFASVTVRALDAGHFLPDEAPEEVAAHLNAFLVP